MLRVAVVDPAVAVNVTTPAGKRSVYATACEATFNCFVSADDDAVTVSTETSLSVAVRVKTSSPPSIDKNGSCSAAVPIFCQSVVPLKNETMMRAEASSADRIAATPGALELHRPVKLISPPPGVWQYGTTRVRPGR